MIFRLCTAQSGLGQVLLSPSSFAAPAPAGFVVSGSLPVVIPPLAIPPLAPATFNPAFTIPNYAPATFAPAVNYPPPGAMAAACKKYNGVPTGPDPRGCSFNGVVYCYGGIDVNGLVRWVDC